MEACLYICSDVPYPDNTGGRKIALGKILELSESYKVKVLCFNFQNVSSSDALKFFNDRCIEFTEIKPKGENVGKFFIYMFSIFSRLPFYSFYMQRSELKDAYDRTLAGATSVFLDNIYTYPLVLGSKPKHFSVMFHNNEGDFFRELSKTSRSFVKKMFYWFETIKVRRLEKLIFSDCNKVNNLSVIFLSKNDMDSYGLSASFKENFASLNANNINVPYVISRDANKENPFFLFPGSIDFPPNCEALLLIAEEYESRNLGVKVIVTGGASETNKRLFSRFPSFVFVGLVPHEKLIELYSECLCVISPLISGSGVKVKNLEAIQLGVELILTEFSNIGVPVSDNKYVTPNKPVEFVDAMVNFYDALLV